MPRCLIQTCPSRNSAKAAENKAILHVFPKSLEKIKRWLLCTGHPFKDLDAYADKILSTKANDNFRICSAHFTKDSYIMKGNVRLLHPDALPCIFLYIPGKPLINEEVRLKVAKKRRFSPPPPPPPPAPPLAGSTSPCKNAAAVVTKDALKADAETQTDLQYSLCIITPEKEQPFPTGLWRVDLEHGYHYLMSTPVKLKVGTVTSEVHATCLEIPLCDDEIGVRCKPEPVNTRITILSPGNHIAGGTLTGPYCVKENAASSMACLREEPGPCSVKGTSSGIERAPSSSMACLREEPDPCNVKGASSGVERASHNKDASSSVMCLQEEPGPCSVKGTSSGVEHTPSSSVMCLREEPGPCSVKGTSSGVERAPSSTMTCLRDEDEPYKVKEEHDPLHVGESHGVDRGPYNKEEACRGSLRIEHGLRIIKQEYDPCSVKEEACSNMACLGEEHGPCTVKEEGGGEHSPYRVNEATCGDTASLKEEYDPCKVKEEVA